MVTKYRLFHKQSSRIPHAQWDLYVMSMIFSHEERKEEEHLQRNPSELKSVFFHVLVTLCVP